MVLLKNIKKGKYDISADYYPEGGLPKGFMRISLADMRVMEHEQGSMFAAQHVRRELEKLALMESPPGEKTVLWY